MPSYTYQRVHPAVNRTRQEPRESRLWSPSRWLPRPRRRFCRHVRKHAIPQLCLWFGDYDGNLQACELLAQLDSIESVVMLNERGFLTVGQVEEAQLLEAHTLRRVRTGAG